MPNVANVLKAEICRIARKEARAETESFKKASASYRHQIASLRKKIDSLERQLRGVSKATAKTASSPEDTGDSEKRLRFSASRFASTRQKLGLSAREMALLIGVSSLSVYKWEKGEARPRDKQLQAISEIRGLGKREAAARLATLAEASE